MTHEVETSGAHPAELEAGRTLDALVAEKVMGLKVRFERGVAVGWRSTPTGGTGEAIAWSPNDYIVLGDDGVPEHVNYWRASMHSYRIVPKYSTDISAAWEVVEKMVSDGHLFIVKGDGLRTGDFQPRWNVLCCNLPRVCADTAPLAICRAALVAMDAAP